MSFYPWISWLPWKKAGGTPRYNEYPEVGHHVWEKAFVEPELVAWVAAQRRGK